MHTRGWIGGLAQPIALGASGLAQTLGIPHLMVTDRQTVLPREAAPSDHQGLGPQQCVYRPVCVPSSSLSPARGAGLCVRKGLLHTWGVHALEGGCSVQWLIVYMQIFVIKTIS